jgi:hypothetical protein
MRREPNEIRCCCTTAEKNRASGRVGPAVTLWVLLVCLLPGTALAIKRDAPVRIGVLTAS